MYSEICVTVFWCHLLLLLCLLLLGLYLVRTIPRFFIYLGRSVTSTSSEIKHERVNRFQDGLVETLRRTRVKFVHCLLPQHNAGCTDNKSLLSVKSNQSEDSVINVPLLRSQVKL